jgi:23S rRNA pseudouridine955/2504/2580 synthase
MKNSIVSEQDDGIRLDRWFKRHYPAVRHGDIQKALRKKDIKVDGQRAEASTRLAAGQVVRHPEYPKDAPQREDSVAAKDKAWIREAVLYKDDRLIAINKPAGWATQGGSGVTQHIDGLLGALKFEAPQKPKLVHRLDRDTSGVLLLARDAKAADALMKKFTAKETRKTYWALVIGVPNPPQGEIKAKLAKRRIGGQEKMLVDEEGQHAVTEYRVMEPLGRKLAWVECAPLTGRTHQLRVHLAHLGCPIYGDYKYGGERAFPEGLQLPAQMHLHARKVVLPDFYGKTLTIEAPLPPHFVESFELLGLKA